MRTKIIRHIYEMNCYEINCLTYLLSVFNSGIKKKENVSLLTLKKRISEPKLIIKGMGGLGEALIREAKVNLKYVFHSNLLYKSFKEKYFSY